MCVCDVCGSVLCMMHVRICTYVHQLILLCHQNQVALLVIVSDWKNFFDNASVGRLGRAAVSIKFTARPFKNLENLGLYVCVHCSSGTSAINENVNIPKS